MGILMSLTRQIIFLLPLIVLFSHVFGIDGVMYAGPIADLAAAILALVFIIRENAPYGAFERKKQPVDNPLRLDIIRLILKTIGCERKMRNISC